MKERCVAEAKRLRSQAVKYLLRGQREGAMSKISTAIECDPEEPEFHVLRCVCVCVCVCVCTRACVRACVSVCVRIDDHTWVIPLGTTNALCHNSNSKCVSFSRGAIHRQNGNYTKAVDELLKAVDKCGEGAGEGEEGEEGGEEGERGERGEGGRRATYKASCRQLVLTYNDFAVLCFR